MLQPHFLNKETYRVGVMWKRYFEATGDPRHHHQCFMGITPKKIQKNKILNYNEPRLNDNLDFDFDLGNPDDLSEFKKLYGNKYENECNNKINNNNNDINNSNNDINNNNNNINNDSISIKPHEIIDMTTDNYDIKEVFPVCFFCFYIIFCFIYRKFRKFLKFTI